MVPGRFSSKKTKTMSLELEWVTVKSSQISHIAFKEDISSLFIKFKNSKQVYYYHPVSKETYDEMKDSKSVGSFFHKNIKTNKEISTNKI